MFKSTHVKQIFRNILGVTAAIYAAITFFLVVIPVVRYFSVARPEFTGSTSKGEIHEHKPFHGGVEIILDNGESYNFYFLGDSPLFVAHWPGEEITMKIPRALSVLGLIPFNLAALLNILWYLDPERWMQ